MPGRRYQRNIRDPVSFQFAGIGIWRYPYLWAIVQLICVRVYFRVKAGIPEFYFIFIKIMNNNIVHGNDRY